MNRTTLAAAMLWAAYFSAMTLEAHDAPRIDYIVSEMQEAKTIETELQAHNKQLENQLKAKYRDYQKKGQDYQKNAQRMTDTVRAEKERELRSLQMSIQQFERDAQLELERKQQQLLQPAYEKVQRAIEAVAKENDYNHVITNEAM